MNETTQPIQFEKLYLEPENKTFEFFQNRLATWGTKNLTLEHVLPRNPEDYWQESFGRENYEPAIDRLGNMAILPASHNAGQEPFAQKRQILKESGYCINQHIAEEYEEWNIESLQHHQKWLADQAKTLWRADSLDK